MKTIRAVGLAACLVLYGFASAPADAANPRGIAVTPASPRAALILKADALPVAPMMKTAYRLTLQTYDPAEKTLRGGPFGGYAAFAARLKELRQEGEVADR